LDHSLYVSFFARAGCRHRESHDLVLIEDGLRIEIHLKVIRENFVLPLAVTEPCLYRIDQSVSQLGKSTSQEGLDRYGATSRVCVGFGGGGGVTLRVISIKLGTRASIRLAWGTGAEVPVVADEDGGAAAASPVMAAVVLVATADDSTPSAAPPFAGCRLFF
jgi:hypothetical protein